MEDGWREMDLSAFHHGQLWRVPGQCGEEVGENVPAEGEKSKEEAYRERKLNPLLHRFGLGRASVALELSTQIYVKELCRYIRSSEVIWLLLIAKPEQHFLDVVVHTFPVILWEYRSSDQKRLLSYSKRITEWSTGRKVGVWLEEHGLRQPGDHNPGSSFRRRGEWVGWPQCSLCAPPTGVVQEVAGGEDVSSHHSKLVPCAFPVALRLHMHLLWRTSSYSLPSRRWFSWATAWVKNASMCFVGSNEDDLTGALCLFRFGPGNYE